ncbi:uncharacterized protein LAESUDRAFT_683058 [Laetiporus sulphureus 93-53]|uniref:F-box domain-containing protein n=1 Tax=Laetiporus sulphureus 93-53 TaxID=1314785 RepID=A0A165D0P9_9APHY|nr:uncharacterized protein LAESUDRAFT_683058 [Laetiporus sulphureus 93-53]KZT03901.1 hypothetical protein LAESUDRAFT_683058 [Laetiporus sulphureus 93-53]
MPSLSEPQPVASTPVLARKQADSRNGTGLHSLPYDLLLNIAQYLDFREIYAVQLTCKALHDFANSRPVYRNLAVSLLQRCRPLPLSGFQRLSDLTTEQLVCAVTKAIRLEQAWQTRAPRPSRASTAAHQAYANPYAVPPDDWERSWYRVIRAPPGEEVDWLSPITSSYSLCATKTGKVVCWDVQRDVCLAEWDPHERWELWKCRVEFDVRTVFFTMAKVLRRPYDDRLMEFVLMQLKFPEADGGGDAEELPTPEFSRLAMFKTIGVVMNVFLLDPPTRLLSAFVWMSSSNTIGLYALLDWEKKEYVFIDTGIEYSVLSNWSCILYNQDIVIHSEDSDHAHQYFYPISVLRQYCRALPTDPFSVPSISTRLSPHVSMTSGFIFPAQPLDSSLSEAAAENGEETQVVQAVDNTRPHTSGTSSQNPNPFPYSEWYPESAHFVRQWWPTLSSIPRLSCTVVLLAYHDTESHRTRYVLAQHYFKVPLYDAYAGRSREEVQSSRDGVPRRSRSLESGSSSTLSDDTASDNADSGRHDDPDWMKLWYVRQPFEVVCVLDEIEDDAEDGSGQAERARPLMAVDFGHAVWIEYVDGDEVDDAKRLRFVSFPPIATDRDGSLTAGGAWEKKSEKELEGVVRTLEIPDELDLDEVETINIDESQGAVIISVREGKIFTMYYE